MSLPFALKVIDLFGSPGVWGGGGFASQRHRLTLEIIHVYKCVCVYPGVNLCAGSTLWVCVRESESESERDTSCATCLRSQNFLMAQYLCINIRRGRDCQFIRGDK